MERRVSVISSDDVVSLGRMMNTASGKKATEILIEVFIEPPSYTRGEPEHTAFLEGQKSVVKFITSAVKASVEAEES